LLIELKGNRDRLSAKIETGCKVNRINFVVALPFIAILLGSAVLTGSSLGQVSPTHPFGQLQHQETPLKLWFGWSSFVHTSSNTNNAPSKLWFGWSSFVRPSSNMHKGMTPYRASNPSSPIQIAAGKIQNVIFAVHNNNAHASPALGPLQNSRNLAISLVPKSNLVRILGPSTWNLPTMSSGSGQELTTPVYAPTYDENGHKVIVDNPVQIKPIRSNQSNGSAILIAAIFIAIGITAIFIRKWPRFDRNENATTRITAVIDNEDSAHLPDGRKEGAPFSPILTD
jgi:hypothetical protein